MLRMRLPLLMLLVLLPVSANSAPSETPLHGVLEAQFTIDRVEATVNGRPSDHSFDHLLGVPITLRADFQSIIAEKRTLEGSGDADHQLQVTTGPVNVTLLGDPTGYLAAHVAPGLQGALQFQLRHDVLNNRMVLFAIHLFPTDLNAPEWFTAEIRDGDISVPTDANGWPILADFHTSGVILLGRHTADAFTDAASGPCSETFDKDAPVPTVVLTLGRIRAAYR